jgi:membrane-associated phospholipid phosphatase
MRIVDAKMAVSSAVVLLLIILSYFFLDIPVTLYCKGLNRNILDVFGIVTEFGISTWYLVGSFALFLFYRFFQRRPIYAHRALFLFSSIAFSGIIADIIKVIIGRYRPEMFFEKGLYGVNFLNFSLSNFSHGLTSFPSGHTATTFSLAWALALFFPRSRIPLFCFAVIVGASRVIITSHYFSDALGGAYVGIMSVILLKEIIGSLDRKFSWGFRLQKEDQNEDLGNSGKSPGRG